MEICDCNAYCNVWNLKQKIWRTRIHSSRMRITRWLTLCHACPPVMHPPSCMPPATHTPLPCMPPAMHAPHHTHPPCHACPPPCTPPTMHAPLPCMPPHHTLPCHTCPPPHTLPHATHAPPYHACPSPGQNSWHRLLKILPCPNFVAGGN